MNKMPNVEIKEEEEIIPPLKLEEDTIIEDNVDDMKKIKKESPFEEPIVQHVVEEKPIVNLKNLNKRALCDMCKEKGFKRYSKLTKQNLINLLNDEPVVEPVKRKTLTISEPEKKIPIKKKVIKKVKKVEEEKVEEEKVEEEVEEEEVEEEVEEEEVEEEDIELEEIIKEVPIKKKVIQKKRTKPQLIKPKKNDIELKNNLKKEDYLIKSVRPEKKVLPNIRPPERKLYNPFVNLYNIT